MKGTTVDTSRLHQSPELEIFDFTLARQTYPDGNERLAFFGFEARGVKVTGATLVRHANGPLRVLLPRFKNSRGELVAVKLSHPLRLKLSDAAHAAYDTHKRNSND